MAAREMGRLSLMHALSLVVLYAQAGSPKFEPAAVRWLARLELEGRGVRLNEVQLVAAALACLRPGVPRRRCCVASNRPERQCVADGSQTVR